MYSRKVNLPKTPDRIICSNPSKLFRYLAELKGSRTSPATLIVNDKPVQDPASRETSSFVQLFLPATTVCPMKSQPHLNNLAELNWTLLTCIKLYLHLILQKQLAVIRSRLDFLDVVLLLLRNQSHTFCLHLLKHVPYQLNGNFIRSCPFLRVGVNTTRQI